MPCITLLPSVLAGSRTWSQAYVEFGKVCSRFSGVRQFQEYTTFVGRLQAYMFFDTIHVAKHSN